MVIECKRCSKRFNLDESFLSLESSRVKCSKCGNIFPSWPPSSTNRKSPSEKTATIKGATTESCLLFPAIQDRKHNRIVVSVPVSCTPEDSEGKPLNLFMGHIREVSQTGVTVELSCRSITGLVSLSFFNYDGKDIHIKGRVVHSVQKKSGKLKLGVSLLGSDQSIGCFVANLVRTHHFTKKPRSNTRVAPAAAIIGIPH